MEDKIYEIIKDWARVPTWHTNHALDQKRFYQAIERLVSELNSPIDIEDFEKALRRHAEQTPDMLGKPNNFDDLIHSFAIKAETLLDYKYETGE